MFAARQTIKTNPIYDVLKKHASHPKVSVSMCHGLLGSDLNLRTPGTFAHLLGRNIK